MASLDWTLVQTFLAVAEHGSLSAAARALRLSQPTLGRQIKALEEQLGKELFQRHERGFQLTSTGAELLPSARAMRDAAHALELISMAKDETLTGTVRITASLAVSRHHLPPLVAQFRERLPEVEIELAPSDDSSNLHYREADIAVRMYRPTQLDLVTQHLGELGLGAFAAKSYVARRGMPGSAEELALHDIVGLDKRTQIIDGFRRAGFNLERDFFKVRCDEQATNWELVRAGCGIGFAQRSIGCPDPELVEIPLNIQLPRLPLWLTAHAAIRHTPRVQRVWELLAQGLREVVARWP